MQNLSSFSSFLCCSELAAAAEARKAAEEALAEAEQHLQLVTDTQEQLQAEQAAAGGADGAAGENPAPTQKLQDC